MLQNFHVSMKPSHDQRIRRNRFGLRTFLQWVQDHPWEATAVGATGASLGVAVAEASSLLWPASTPYAGPPTFTCTPLRSQPIAAQYSTYGVRAIIQPLSSSEVGMTRLQLTIVNDTFSTQTVDSLVDIVLRNNPAGRDDVAPPGGMEVISSGGATPIPTSAFGMLPTIRIPNVQPRYQTTCTIQFIRHSPHEVSANFQSIPNVTAQWTGRTHVTDAQIAGNKVVTVDLTPYVALTAENGQHGDIYGLPNIYRLPSLSVVILPRNM